jgi:uncharacterized membrane protein YoaK (UPF0700 family)
MASDLTSAQRPAPAIMPARVPVLLSVLAGYVDSCTFLALFGLFVAQVTGSFVLAGTLLVTHQNGALIKLLAIPAFFVAGVATTVIVRRVARGRSALPATLGLEATLLTGLFACWLRAGPFTDPDAPAAVLASLFGLSAMGVQSALVRLLAKPYPSTNVMTTNTTQLAIDAADLAMTWRARRRSPHDAAVAAAYAGVKDRLTVLAPIVLGFLAGTIAGAVAYTGLDLWCVLLAIAVAAGLAAWTGLRGD